MGRLLNNVIVVVHKDSRSPLVFRNKKSLKEWMKLEGLKYKSFIYNGKKSIDKYSLEDNQQDENNEWDLNIYNPIK